MTDPRVIGHRVDALTLAYRVRVDEELVKLLESRANVAREHGRASFSFRTLRGELGHSRATRTWHIKNERAGWRVMIDLKAAGATDLPNGERIPGWTVEVIWYAQALAELPHVGVAVTQTRALVDAIGAVYDARVRRVDICADVAGASVAPDDVERLVRRARAKVTAHGIEEPIDEPLFAAATSHHASRRRISGISVCPGGAIMARLYDKRRELAQQPEEKREAEEERWRARGWDGDEGVLRVEFQIRGTAIKELGIRDPTAPQDAATGRFLHGDRLEHRIDPVWQLCLEWARLVQPGVPKPGKKYAHLDRLSECADDPIWTALRALRFYDDGKARAMATRRRIRGGVSAAQVFGCALSILGYHDELVPLSEAIQLRDDYSEEELQDFKHDVIATFVRVGDRVAEDLLDRWGPTLARRHVAITQNAVIARLAAARQWEEVALASACA